MLVALQILANSFTINYIPLNSILQKEHNAKKTNELTRIFMEIGCAYANVQNSHTTHQVANFRVFMQKLVTQQLLGHSNTANMHHKMSALKRRFFVGGRLQD